MRACVCVCVCVCECVRACMCVGVHECIRSCKTNGAYITFVLCVDCHDVGKVTHASRVLHWSVESHGHV